MSSILTNTSAMVALQTLRGVNSSLAKTQDEISTGKSVATAKDNAAVWAISKVMESDVTGFKGISDSLSLGSSTVAVAQQAAETVTDLLTQMKAKIVSAQDDNVDRVKIQTDVAALRDWALAEKIALTVVGPEQPLAAGVVDDFRAHGLRIFGPTKAAAQLESSSPACGCVVGCEHRIEGALSRHSSAICGRTQRISARTSLYRVQYRRDALCLRLGKFVLPFDGSRP